MLFHKGLSEATAFRIFSSIPHTRDGKLSMPYRCNRLRSINEGMIRSPYVGTDLNHYPMEVVGFGDLPSSFLPHSIPPPIEHTA